MESRLHTFGRLADGRPVRAATLRRGDLAVQVIEYGAAVTSLRFGGVETVLGFANLAQYEADSSYQGVVVGRVANRIAGAAFDVDGERFEVTANEGENCLHGGRPGLDKRLWRFTAAEETRAALAYDSPAGEEGFPGAMQCRVELVLSADDTLEIIWEAEADRATPVNLTHHLYFNLSGDASHDLLDHELMIRADAITPVRPDLIPTGEFLPVEGTPFDLRRLRPLGEMLAMSHPQLEIGGGYDHNWVLNDAAGSALVLRHPASGLSLALETDHPGMQVYSGQGLKPPFAAHGGIVFEPQNFPDAINQPNFPDAVLRPGDLYRRRVAYRLERRP